MTLGTPSTFDALRSGHSKGEVKCALKQAGFPTAEVEEEIDGLDCGVTCEMPVSGSQRDRFYSLAEENEFTEPIQ
jgi:hypothetical protein